MAVYHAPALILVPALVAGLAVAARAGLARRASREAPASDHSATGPTAGPGVPIALAAAWLALLLGAWALFPAAERWWPIALGLSLGAALAGLWNWAWPDSERDPHHLAPMGSGLAAVALLALVVGDATHLANGLLGLLGGWGTLALLPRLRTEAHTPAPLGLVVTAAVAGGAAWGEKLHPGANLGAPLAVGLGAALVLALAIGAALAKGEAPGWSSRLAAFAVYALSAVGLIGGLYGQGATLVIAAVLGGAVGLLAPFALANQAAPNTLRALIFLAVGGALLIVDNRLMGILGIALGGIGLGVGALSGASVRPLVTLLIAVFAARAWLQLFLDRTMLAGYGIDLTHPYAFATLILGGLLPVAAIAVARLARPNTPLTALWVLALALAPAWVGYFVHVEALGSLLAGLLLAAFALGLQDGPEAETRTLIPALLITHVAVTLLAAPWLVSVMNATRQDRLGALVAALVIAFAWLTAWWLTLGRRQAPQV